MVNKIISRSKNLFSKPQSSVTSAATIIMVMVATSRVLGLARQRILAHFFKPDELSLFFAAFRLPDMVFEILVFGTFSAAFIPVFTKALKKGRSEAWDTAGRVTNISLIAFAFFAFAMAALANNIYSVVAPGFSLEERAQIVKLARILFAAQGFFVISYVLTGALESLRRFLVPALAPPLYNLGIIVVTYLFAPQLGLLAPVIGVFVGALSHLLIQLPLAMKLGFKFTPTLKVNKNVKKIGKLALPRIIELSFLQVSKTVELFLASIISTASYTFLTLANSVQLLPVGLFGTSIAKAALPTLSRQAEKPERFKRTVLASLYEIVFLVLPIATILAVLRIPIVRLIFGTQIFDWSATVQTGEVLSAFAVGIVFQATAPLLARAFYALHDTKTPVLVSLFSITLSVVLSFVFVKGFSLPTWGLAAAFSIGSAFQATVLYFLINKRLKNSAVMALGPVVKSTVAAAVSGSLMYFLLKVFDRSVWVKRLSFLGKIESAQVLPFQRFVLDTRYTVNLFALTVLVSLAGLIIYLGLSIILKSGEVWTFFNLLKRLFTKLKPAPIPRREQEPVSPSPKDSNTP